MSASRRLLVVSLMLLPACSEAPRSTPALDGDAETGRALLRQFGCGQCHAIPGVATANGTAGPPLDRIARRVYLGGVASNTPQNMVHFIRDPQAFDPQSMMPNLGVSEPHARDMTAYLYTLH